MIINDEKENICSESELEESFSLFTEEMSDTHFVEMDMGEFLEEYCDHDDLMNYIEDEFKYVDDEVSVVALEEYAMVNSYLNEANSTPTLGNALNNTINNVKNQGKQISKQMNKTPIATNIFVRIFNVVKNAFGVIAAFMEKAITTFKINKLRNAIASLPDSVQLEGCKGIIDNTVGAGLKAITNCATSATKFLSNIFIVGRFVDQKQVKAVNEKFTKTTEFITGKISEMIKVSKDTMLRQLDALAEQFRAYSQIKILQRSFLTVMNACSNPVKLANAADKLMKATSGQGFTGKAGAGLDVLNKTAGNKNPMSIPWVNQTVNTSCKLIGIALSQYKKVISTNLQNIKAAYDKAISDPRNTGAIKKHQRMIQQNRI